MSAKPTGTFCWADLMPADQGRALTFYSQLAGWNVIGGPASGGYGLAFLGEDENDGRIVAGVNPAVPGGNANWTLYLATDDVSITLGRIGRAGGKELVPATEIPGMGIAALAADPTGAPFGLWQAKGHDGFEAFAEPGAFCWAEVYSSDAARTRDFFVKALGLESSVLEESEAFTYYQLTAPGESDPTFGVMQMGNAFPASTTSHFAGYLNVSNVDEMINRMALRGASVINAPSDTPFGRMATLLDSEGAMIKVVDPALATRTA